MSEQEQDPLWDELQAYIGRSLAGEAPARAPDPVNMPMIRHWADAFDDRNPVYENVEVAAQTRFGDLVAPQAMMQVWTMARPILEGIAERGGAGVKMDDDHLLIKLDKAGYNATLATNSELEFLRPLRLGETLESDVIVDSISPRKKTGLGLGYFVTWISNYRDESGALVGRQTFRVLKFNPMTMEGMA
jgi:acyl dehydratase